MSDVKRYRPPFMFSTQRPGRMDERTDGDYVTYDDYAALEAENAILKQMWWDANDVTDLAGTIVDLKEKLAKADVTAIERILNERGRVFDAMVEAAEDAVENDVSFNVVIGLALRAAIAELRKD